MTSINQPTTKHVCAGKSVINHVTERTVTIMQLIPLRVAANANYSSNVMHVCRHTDELNFGYAVIQIDINEFTLTTCMFGICGG